MIAIEPRSGFKRRGVRTRTGFGQAIAGDFVHADQLRHIARLQFRTAKGVDHPRRHIVDRDKGGGRGTAIGHGLHDQRGFQPTKPDPAIFLGNIDCTEAKLAGGLPDINRIMMLLVPLTRKRRDAVGGEFARHILNGDLVVGEGKLVGHFFSASFTTRLSNQGPQYLYESIPAIRTA